MVGQKENRIPRAFQIELKSLLDHEELLHRQTRSLETAIAIFDEKIRDTLGARDLALANRDRGVNEIAKLVEQHFPYDMNAVKPMGELLAEFPPPLRLHELTEGNRCRVDYLWRPQREMLVNYLKILKSFKTHRADKPED